jgi:replicative DNA helicase
MIDELASEGKEVKLVSFDYIKKAKADEPTGDMRIDLGNISDGFSLLAKDYNIPFVTATQINRATVDNIMKAEGLEKQVKSANASGIGDSWMMAENSDVVIMAFKEIIEDENGGFKAYIALKLEKMRGKLKSAKKTFIHPFEANNDMKLMHDIFMKTSLSMDKMPDTNRNTPKMVMRGGKTLPLNKNIVSLDELDEDEDEADDYGIRRG